METDYLFGILKFFHNSDKRCIPRNKENNKHNEDGSQQHICKTKPKDQRIG